MSTPLMRQYAQVKAKHPGTILLFRMGDFFETFEEDARTAARLLGITLTKRGNGAAGEVPLAGFPHHALDTYLPKLLKAGHRVAICEQLEDPKQARGLVRRDVIEVVTPGVAFSDKVLEQKQNNFLAAVFFPSPLATGGDTVGFAFVDVSTGEFSAGEFPLQHLREQVQALNPAEILVQKRDAAAVEQLLADKFRGLYTKEEDWIFSFDFGYELLISHFNTRSLKGLGIEEMRHGIAAAGAIMRYLQETQKSNLGHLRRITPYYVGDHIVLDPSTKRNLEITSSLAGNSEGTLIAVLDKTETPMGARLLRRWIHQPLNQVAPVVERLDAVAELVSSGDARKDAARTLGRVGDLERLTTRICTGRATPRDMIGLTTALAETVHVQRLLAATRPQATMLAAISDGLQPLQEIVDLIAQAIVPDPPNALNAGGVIRTGFSTELDELRDLAFNGKKWIAELQQQERERTGISSLKVGFNNVFGYYIEITHTHAEKVPEEYIRKQTLTNAERYVTPALKEHEEKILHAEERIAALELELFTGIRMRTAACAEALQENARLLATLDCLQSLASAAVEYKYVRPEVNDSTTLKIVEGRHPVIERLLPPGETYIPNDLRVDTDQDQIFIITGPNMSGKSSYLRQAGLIVLLAQVGSFVPARQATLGIVDKIFTRVGASDNIASGESTFLVEMHEAAHIVNTATRRSLILLDEVGRGTSTFDGISIAWALTEYLHEKVGARTLFATHYHELNELAGLFPRIRNLKVEVREYGDTVVFLHKVSAGFADHSYGIHVARMAGLPAEITERASAILRNLEGTDLSVHGETGEGRTGSRLASSGVQMTLFEAYDDELRRQLREINIDALTPLEALQHLAALKRRAME